MTKPVDLPLGFLFRIAVPVLNSIGKFVSVTVNRIQIVFSEVCPLLFDAAFELLPVLFNLIPLHRTSPLMAGFHPHGFL